jgi:NitT/TauT family transport system permease protein
MSKLSAELKPLLYPIIVLVVLVAVWQLAASSSSGNSAGVPAPSDIFAALAREPGLYLGKAAITFFEAAVGLILAVCFGLLVASAFVLSSSIRSGFLPLVIAMQTIPLVAVAPILNVYLGNGIVSKIVVAALLCWFPTIMNATRGMLDVNPAHAAVFDIYAARKMHVFWKLRVPNSVAFVASGIRISAALAMIGTIVAEYSDPNNGLGWFIFQLSVPAPKQPDRLYAAILVASAAGVALTELSHFLISRMLQRYIVKDEGLEAVVAAG